MTASFIIYSYKLIFQPFAGKGNGGRTCHIDVAVFFIVFDMKGSQVQLNVNTAAGKTIHERTDGAGAGTGSASQGSAGTAFPGMDLDRMVVDDLDKVHIGLTREGLMGFKFRT